MNWGNAGRVCPLDLRWQRCVILRILLLLLLPWLLLVSTSGGCRFPIPLGCRIGESGCAARDVHVLSVVRDVLQGELGAIPGAEAHCACCCCSSSQSRISIRICSGGGGGFYTTTGRGIERRRLEGGEKSEGRILSIVVARCKCII